MNSVIRLAILGPERRARIASVADTGSHSSCMTGNSYQTMWHTDTEFCKVLCIFREGFMKHTY